MLGRQIIKRLASTGSHHNSGQISIPRRPLKKIRLGKARPAIYHEFTVQVELSDGSVITRRSQFPKEQLRLIQDQRNNPLWNPSRDDLVVVDANASGKLDKFEQRYGSLFSMKSEKPKTGGEAPDQADGAKQAGSGAEDSLAVDDYLSLLNEDASQIKTGKLATKKKSKK